MATMPAKDATSRSFQLSYNPATNSVVLSCPDPVEDGGLNISLPATEGEGAKALKILQKMGLAPKDTEADKDIPLRFTGADRRDEVYAYEGIKASGANGFKALMAIPIGVKKKDKVVCLNFSPSLRPNTIVATHDQEARDRLIHNIIRYNVRFSHVFETVIYSREVGKHQRGIGLKVLTNEFELLMFLREIAEAYTKNTDPRRVIIIEDFAALVEGMKSSADAASERTTKAVRAEILSLIQDLSTKRGKNECGWNTHFVFCLESVNDKDYNAFLPTVDARIAIGEVGQSSYKLFGKNINSYSAWNSGRAYIQQEGFNGLFQS